SQFHHDAFGSFGADEGELLQEQGIATFDGSSDLVDRLDETLQSLHESDAGHRSEGFEEFPVQRIEEADKFWRQMTASETPVDVINRVERQRISPLALRHVTQPRGDARRHEYFVAKRIRAQQERVPPDTIVKDLTRNFGDQESSPSCEQPLLFAAL